MEGEREGEGQKVTGWGSKESADWEVSRAASLGSPIGRLAELMTRCSCPRLPSSGG